MRLLPRSIALALSAEGGAARTSTEQLVDRAYWLAHCEGFGVDAPGGRIGVVDHVVPGSRADGPDSVSVASGLLRIHYTRLPVADVVEVLPDQGRLVVRGSGTADPR